MRGAALLAGLAAALLFASCGGSGAGDRDGEREGKLKVVTSLPLFADFVRQVGGDGAEVTAVVPPGADPETFEPTPRDIRDVSQADVVFINGGGLESAFERTVRENVPEGTPVVRFAERFQGENPHYWLSVDNAVLYVQAVFEALAAADPDDAASYEQGFQAYRQELTALGDELRQTVSSIPVGRRKLVTAHDAFPYFAEYLGLELVGFVTPSEAQEPSPGDVRELVEAIRREGAPAVFAEPGFSDRTLEQVAAEAGVPVCQLYSDALDKRASTYVEMMRFNGQELARCLGGGGGG